MRTGNRMVAPPAKREGDSGASRDTVKTDTLHAIGHRSSMCLGLPVIAAHPNHLDTHCSHVGGSSFVQVDFL